MLFGCGLPLMFMELALGQYSSEGPLTVWKLSPLFKGLGIGMVLCSVILSVYYNMITGWALYYLMLSIRELLPWTCCEDGWSTEHCVSFAKQDVCPAGAGAEAANQSFFWEAGSKAKFAADEFFHNSVLSIAPGTVGNSATRPGEKLRYSAERVEYSVHAVPRVVTRNMRGSALC
jgi:hypothetical protein